MPFIDTATPATICDVTALGTPSAAFTAPETWPHTKLKAVGKALDGLPPEILALIRTALAPQASGVPERMVELAQLRLVAHLGQALGRGRVARGRGGSVGRRHAGALSSSRTVRAQRTVSGMSVTG